ncbi:MAG: hypothetical protein ACKPHU_09820, partial [Planctomycetaceae bacterium]
MSGYLAADGYGPQQSAASDYLWVKPANLSHRDISGLMSVSIRRLELQPQTTQRQKDDRRRHKPQVSAPRSMCRLFSGKQAGTVRRCCWRHESAVSGGKIAGCQLARMCGLQGTQD